MTWSFARRWVGMAVVAIGIIHVLFGVVVFRGTLVEILRDGIVNTVNGQPDRELSFWFIIFGILTILLGALIDWCEANAPMLPRFLGWSLLGLTGICVLIMPLSGGWLLVVPSIGAITRSKTEAR